MYTRGRCADRRLRLRQRRHVGLFAGLSRPGRSIRAAAVIDASPPARPPGERSRSTAWRSIWPWPKNLRMRGRLRLIDRREQKIPVTVKYRARRATWTRAELGELARWIDMLDRI